MFNNTAFNQARIAAEVTDTELADFMGISRRFMWQVTLCKEPVTPSFFSALKALVAQRA